jgi:tetratricopeptide (TPR) repeat protein
MDQNVIRFDKLKRNSLPANLDLPAEMEKRALAGSVIAKNFLEGKRLIAKAIKIYENANSFEKFLLVGSLLRQSLRVSRQQVVDENDSIKMLVTIELLCEQKSEDGMYLRTIMGDTKRPNAGQFHLSHALECVRLFPGDPEFIIELGLWHELNRDYENACKCYKKAVEMRPDRVAWLFRLAEGLRFLTSGGIVGNRQQEVIDAYQRHIDLNEPDEPHVPMAYYQISLILALENKYELAEEFYRKGVAAENVRLPCWGEIGEEWETKKRARVLILGALATGKYGNLNSDADFVTKAMGELLKCKNVTNSAGSGREEAIKTAKVTCDNCGKKLGQNIFDCGKCNKARYCTEKCMKKNGKIHLIGCK